MQIPDPNLLSTYQQSRWSSPLSSSPSGSGSGSGAATREWREFYRRLLELRHREIVPWLDECRSLGAEVLAEGCVRASWRLGDSRRLSIVANLGERPLDRLQPAGNLLVASDIEAVDSLRNGRLAAACTVAFLEAW